MASSPNFTAVHRESPAPGFQLTVVTVCRNALADLKSTVESVLAQKAKGRITIEHVVVDGASTDGTPEWLAAQQAAGNIERYVSEPDAGIYDAMNKGINLARGHVLAFLNAGDTYRADANLAACVLPIVEGRCAAAAATSQMHGDVDELYHRPRYGSRYLTEPCNHQAFFASAVLYRENGGYDSEHFRCIADMDLIHRMCNKHGAFLAIDEVLTDFQAGGLSTNCHENYRDEYLELLWRNREQLFELSRRDGQYREVLHAALCDHCFHLLTWQQEHGRKIPREITHLATICQEASSRAGTRRVRAALRYLGGTYLPRLAAGDPVPARTKWVLLACQCACAPGKDNPHLKEMPFPRITFRGVLLDWMHKGAAALKRKLHG